MQTMALEKSERFKKEYSDFKTRISKITDDRVKTELLAQLGKLVSEVRAIDEQHETLWLKKELPAIATDTRDRIATTRRAINKKLEDWERVYGK